MAGITQGTFGGGSDPLKGFDWQSTLGTYAATGGQTVIPLGSSDFMTNMFDPFNLFHSEPTTYTQFPQASKWTPEQQTLMQSLMSYLTPYVANPSTIPTYTGQLTAGLSDAQQSGIGNLMQFANPNTTENKDVLSQIMKLISGANYDPSYMRRAYKEGVEKPLLQTYKEDVMPSLKSSYGSKGLFYGSDKEKAIENQSESLMDSLAKGRADLESSIYNQGQQNQMAGIDDFSNFLTTQGGINNLLMSAGGTAQTTQQNAITALYNQWAQKNMPGKQPYDELLTAIMSLYPMYEQETVVPGKESSGSKLGGIGSIISAFL